MSSTYAHESLVSPNHIRLLELLPGEASTPVSALVHQVYLPPDDDDSPAATPDYTALSYTWGPDIKADEVPIWLDGESFPARPNLFAALKALRRTEVTVTLWVDAVCINQADVYERNHQVARMGRIYRAAKVVKVWLRMESEDREKDLSIAVEYLQSREGEEWLNGGGDDSQTRGAASVQTIQTLLEHEYWSRAWIVQEVILATELIVHCGTALTFRWDELIHVYQLIQQRLTVSSATHLIDRRTAIVRKQRPLLTQTLESLVRTHHTAKCSERRDRIYAFLSLASDCVFSQGLQPDYAVPRLTLLVQVLEFCRPADPVDFVSILFSALTNDKNDVAWEKAAGHWVESSQASTALALSSDGTATSNSEGVQVTHFVAASSTSRDWARCYTFPALLDRSVDQDAGTGDVEVRKVIHNRVESTGSLQYQDRVYKLGDSQVGVLLHERHRVVFSTFRMSASMSPCNALGLHTKEENCGFAHCGLLRSG